MWVGTLGVSAGFAASPKMVGVKEVQEWIVKEHANWRAKDSWLTRLSESDVQRMFGLQHMPTGSLDFSGIQAKGASSIDWRNNNGVNWLGPVMNQGNCGSCVAFSAIATLEAQTTISSGLPWLHPTFSPQQVFACGGGGCETGWEPAGAADFLKSTGAVDEACMPYTSGSTGQDVSCNTTCADASSRTTRIANYTTPSSFWGHNANSVKAALAHGPLQTTLTVYADFMTYAGGVYKHVTGAALGGHAISIVGYDDSKQAWLIRNSWGEEWGEKGFAWVAYTDTSGVGAETWSYETASPQGFIGITSPSDREYVSGTYNLVAQTQGSGMQATPGAVQFHIVGEDGRAFESIACSAQGANNCAAAIDTTQMKEGHYTIFADLGAVRSQVREFYVINSVPQMSLTLAPGEGTDLSKPQSDRPLFNITAQSGAVPMQSVEFRVIDANGKIVSTKSDPYVLSEMVIGWRTMTAPNGTYTIQVHGQLPFKGQMYTVDSNTLQMTVRNK